MSLDKQQRRSSLDKQQRRSSSARIGSAQVRASWSPTPKRTKPMPEATETPLPVSTSRSKYKSAATTPGTPKLEMPNFEMPKMEIPAAFREMAEKSVSQAKETYEKMK